MEGDQSVERRQSRRVDVSFWVESAGSTPLTVRSIYGGKEVESVILDLSAGGMGILSDFEIPVAAIVTVKFSLLVDPGAALADQYKSVQVDAEVKYNLFQKEKNAYRIGLCFIDISEPALGIIADFVKSRL